MAHPLELLSCIELSCRPACQGSSCAYNVSLDGGGLLFKLSGRAGVSLQEEQSCTVGVGTAAKTCVWSQDS